MFTMKSSKSYNVPIPDDDPHHPDSPSDWHQRHQWKRKCDAYDEERLPKTVPNWQHLYQDGLNELQFKYGPARRAEQCDEMTRLLDRAVGIQQHPKNPHLYIGVTVSAQRACRYLPLYLARPIEYENVARRLNCTEIEIGGMHAVLHAHAPAWSKRDVDDTYRDSAVEYVMRSALGTNHFAKRVLLWLAPRLAAGLCQPGNGGRDEYLRAIRDGERDRAVQLGRMLGGGELGHHCPIRPDDTAVMALSARQQKAMAANNIGYLLLHGMADVKQDVPESINYYKMAVAWGSAAAASNLGFVYYHGAKGIGRDGARAERMYRLAIERGERNFAPRNLAILLYHGARGVRADIRKAVMALLVGVRIGDPGAKAKCRKSLKLMMRSWRFMLVGVSVKDQCADALDEDVGVAGDDEAVDRPAQQGRRRRKRFSNHDSAFDDTFEAGCDESVDDDLEVQSTLND